MRGRKHISKYFTFLVGFGFLVGFFVCVFLFVFFFFKYNLSVPSGYFKQTSSPYIQKAVGKENTSLYKTVRIIVTLL